MKKISKPKYPGQLIQRHQEMLKKGKAPKGEKLSVEKAELSLMKKGAKKVAKKVVVKKVVAKKTGKK